MKGVYLWWSIHTLGGLAGHCSQGVRESKIAGSEWLDDYVCDCRATVNGERAVAEGESASRGERDWLTPGAIHLHAIGACPPVTTADAVAKSGVVH